MIECCEWLSEVETAPYCRFQRQNKNMFQVYWYSAVYVFHDHKTLHSYKRQLTVMKSTKSIMRSSIATPMKNWSHSAERQPYHPLNQPYYRPSLRGSLVNLPPSQMDLEDTLRSYLPSVLSMLHALRPRNLYWIKRALALFVLVSGYVY